MIKFFKSLVAKWQLRKEYKQREKERALYKDSSEPWVHIIGSIEDPSKGVKLDLDWNDAFIKYLRENKVPGITDEDVVSYWVTTIHQSKLSAMDYNDE
jgi:hypothetical protein